MCELAFLHMVFNILLFMLEEKKWLMFLDISLKTENLSVYTSVSCKKENSICHCENTTNYSLIHVLSLNTKVNGLKIKR